MLKNNKGLTLIEVLAVIVILGIVAAIAVPTVMDAIGDSQAKSFSEELNSLQTLAQQYNLRATTLDYTKLTEDGSENGPFNREYVDAALQQKNLPQKTGLTYETGQTHVEIQLTGTYDASGNLESVTGAYSYTAGGPYNTPIATTLAEQLGQIYLSGNITSTNTEEVVFQAFPIDVELLYTGGLMTNKLRFPTDKPDNTEGYGNLYQNRNSVTALQSSNLLFPAENTTSPGNFFITDNGRVFYSGTDAAFQNGEKAVHVAGAYSK